MHTNGKKTKKWNELKSIVSVSLKFCYKNRNFNFVVPNNFKTLVFLCFCIISN